MSGYENLKLVANLYKNVDKKRIDEIVKLVGLENRIKDKVSKYSLGMRQRLGIAQAILHRPKLLILDEPTNHLDSETQLIIAETFKTFKGTMLIVSHNPDFVDNLGIERTLILPEGELSYYDRSVVEHYHELNSNYNSRKKRM